MEKSYILFLSLLFASFFVSGQSTAGGASCNCSSVSVRDSLITRYAENGAHRRDYNSPEWQLYYDSLLAVCPNVAYAWQQKAMPLIKSAHYMEAYRYLDKAVECDSLRYTPYRGFLKCIFSKDYEGALVDFKKAQQLSPGTYEMDHTYFFFMGLCQLQLGNYPEAEKLFESDIAQQTHGSKKNSAHFNSLLYMGITCYEKGDWKKAEKHLLRGLKEYKQSPHIHYYLALVHRKRGNLKNEKKHLDAAVRAFKQGYGFNEDNDYYVNYPYEAKYREVVKEWEEVEKK